MELGRMLGAADIAASGLSAERFRMDITTNNIANAHVTRSADGEPYRRQQAIFTSVTRDPARARESATAATGGVRIAGIEQDTSPLQRVHNPGHPDADADGFVMLPNVQIPREMVDLLTASRAYEANLKSLQMFQRMSEQALSLMRGGR